MVKVAVVMWLNKFFPSRKACIPGRRQILEPVVPAEQNYSLEHFLQTLPNRGVNGACGKGDVTNIISNTIGSSLESYKRPCELRTRQTRVIIRSSDEIEKRRCPIN